MAVTISARSSVMVFALPSRAYTPIGAAHGFACASLLSLLRMFLEEICYRFEQLPADRAGYTVAFTGVDGHVEELPGLFQGLGDLHGVLEEHVIIFEIVNDEQVGFQVGGIIHGRAGAVAFGVFRWKTQVALGVDGVVIPPIRNRRARDAGPKYIRRVQQ